MALSKVEKELLAEVVDTLDTAATWVSGPRQFKLVAATEKLRQFSGGTAASKLLDAKPEEGDSAAEA